MNTNNNDLNNWTILVRNAVNKLSQEDWAAIANDCDQTILARRRSAVATASKLQIHMTI